MRALAAALALLLGAALGYVLTPPAPATPAAAPDAAVATEAAAARRPLPRVPRSGPVAAAAPLALRDLPRPPLPSAQPSWSPLQQSLRQRAEAGDAAAATEWQQRDSRCYGMLMFTPRGADPTLPTRNLQMAVENRAPRAMKLDPQFAAIADIADEAQRKQSLATLQQQLLDECRGYTPEDPKLRYALGEIAARLGSDKDFWKFINDPPLAANYSRDVEQAIDWARRAPLMVQERAAAGDAQAAFALGLAYAIDNARDIESLRLPPQYLAAAVPNDPVQAYRWLSRYLRSGGDAQQTALAQELLARVDAGLSAEQRARAQQ